jgi:hypothetical protein
MIRYSIVMQIAVSKDRMRAAPAPDGGRFVGIAGPQRSGNERTE